MMKDRTIFPDTPDGKYRKVNGVWYNAELEAIKAFEQRVDDEMDERVFSDTLNATAMGMSKETI